MTNPLYHRLRNIPVYKSKKFLKWVKDKYPTLETHHLLGSMTGVKLCDYLVKPVTREEHELAECNKSEFAVDNLHTSLKILFEYISEIEK